MDGLIVQQPLIPLVWTPYGWMPLAIPEFPPGTDIYFTVPVTNQGNTDTRVWVAVNVHQGSQLGSPGDKLTDEPLDSTITLIPAGETEPFRVPMSGDWTTQELGAGITGYGIERDLSIKLYYEKEGSWEELDWENKQAVYAVPELEYAFSIGQPTVSQA